MKSYKHSDKFYENKYQQLKSYAIKEGIRLPFRNISEFKSQWDSISKMGSENVMKDLKYSIEYNTDYKTAVSEYKAQKEFGGNLKLEQIKRMSTQEFADSMKNQINDFYKEMRAKGLSASEIKDFTAAYWFGSD